ncbi:MAG: hypothetical protein LBB88_05235, partial [Planctomycetaceae bacterium]|nr:hypothetical protein [Planctomycetaceae bacterium]
MKIGHISLLSILAIFIITLSTFYYVGTDIVSSNNKQLQSKHKLLDPLQENYVKKIDETELALANAEKQIAADNSSRNNNDLKRSAKIAGEQIKLQLQEIINAAETLANINAIQKNSIERKSRTTNPNGILIIPAVKQSYYQEVAFRKKKQSNYPEQKRQNKKIKSEIEIENNNNNNFNEEIIVIPSKLPNYFAKSIQSSFNEPTKNVDSNFTAAINQIESQPEPTSPAAENKTNPETQLTTAETKTEIKSETKTETKTEIIPITETETKTEIETKSETKIETKTETITNNNSDNSK